MLLNNDFPYTNSIFLKIYSSPKYYDKNNTACFLNKYKVTLEIKGIAKTFINLKIASKISVIAHNQIRIINYILFGLTVSVRINYACSNLYLCEK